MIPADPRLDSACKESRHEERRPRTTRRDQARRCGGTRHPDDKRVGYASQVEGIVGKGEWRKLVWEREDDVYVWHIQKLLFAARKPLVTSVGLTLSAMAVTTRNGELTITCLMGSLF
jgi:hypothetical protein